MSRSPKGCSYPHCEDFEDLERDCRLCSKHAERWLQSKAFAAATHDENVRFAAGLSKTLGRRELAKHRRRWIKAEDARELAEQDGEVFP